MPYYHPDAVLNRKRVYIVHDACGFPISSRTVFASIDDALRAIRIYKIDWDDRKDRIRVSYDLRGRLGFWTHYTAIRIYDSRDRQVPDDVVYARVLGLRREQLARYYNTGRPRYTEADFRSGPVVNIGKRRRSHWRRHIRTTAERRAAEHLEVDDDCIEHGIRARARRNLRNLPSWHDDPGRADHFNDGWKSNRKNQWKGA